MVQVRSFMPVTSCQVVGGALGRWELPGAALLVGALSCRAAAVRSRGLGGARLLRLYLGRGACVDEVACCTCGGVDGVAAFVSADCASELDLHRIAPGCGSSGLRRMA